MSYRLLIGVFTLGLLVSGAGCSSRSGSSTNPTSSMAPTPSQEEVSKMTPEQRETALQSYLLQNPMPQWDTETAIQETNRMRQIVEQGRVLRVGRLFGDYRNANGEARILQKDGVWYLALGEDFSLDTGPGLVIELSEHANPQSAAELQSGLHFVVAPLRSARGGHVYELPAFDLDKMKTLVIHSPSFQTIYAVASLQEQR